MTDELEDYWQDLRPKPPKVPLERLQKWRDKLLDGGEPVMAVEVKRPQKVRYGGPTPLHTAMFNQVINQEVLQLLIVDGAPSVTEPLRSILDTNPRPLGDAFKLLLEASLTYAEKPSDGLPQAYYRWAFGQDPGPNEELLDRAGVKGHPETPSDRFDAMMLVLTLAHEKGLTGPVVAGLSSVDRVTKEESLCKELAQITTSVIQWNRLGSPLGLVLKTADQKEAETFLASLADPCT